MPKRIVRISSFLVNEMKGHKGQGVACIDHDSEGAGGLLLVNIFDCIKHLFEVRFQMPRKLSKPMLEVGYVIHICQSSEQRADYKVNP